MRKEIEIDIDDFSTYEILSELSFRSHKLSTLEKKELVELARRISSTVKPEKNISLYDQQKIDFLNENMDKIKLEDLEKLIWRQ